MLKTEIIVQVDGVRPRTKVGTMKWLVKSGGKQPYKYVFFFLKQFYDVSVFDLCNKEKLAKWCYTNLGFCEDYGTEFFDLRGYGRARNSYRVTARRIAKVTIVPSGNGFRAVVEPTGRLTHRWFWERDQPRTSVFEFKTEEAEEGGIDA